MPSSVISFMRKACLLCDRSKCGYKTGCVCVTSGTVLLESFNETLPGELFCQNGNCFREQNNLKGGTNIDMVCSIHAEATLVAKAASEGISIKGSDIYVSTFPCLICARLLAKAKIKNLYYMSSYMGGNKAAPILEAAGVKLINIPKEEVWN